MGGPNIYLRDFTVTNSTVGMIGKKDRLKQVKRKYKR